MLTVLVRCLMDYVWAACRSRKLESCCADTGNINGVQVPHSRGYFMRAASGPLAPRAFQQICSGDEHGQQTGSLKWLPGTPLDASL